MLKLVRMLPICHEQFSVTGSAHAALAPLWSALLDKTVMRASQCSARGGDLGLTHFASKCLY